VSNKGRRSAAAIGPDDVEIAFGYVLIHLIFMETGTFVRSLR
jgi:hypothetical protein